MTISSLIFGFVLLVISGNDEKKPVSLVDPRIYINGNSIVVLNFPDPETPGQKEKFNYYRLNELIYDKLTTGKFPRDYVFIVAYFEFTNIYGNKSTYKLQSYTYSISEAKKYRNFQYWYHTYGDRLTMNRIAIDQDLDIVYGNLLKKMQKREWNESQSGKPNDIISGVIQNPTADIKDFIYSGLNKSNTALFTEEHYKKFEKIKAIYNAYGEFDSRRFHDIYIQGLKLYDQLD